MGNEQMHYSVLTMPGAGQWKQVQRADHCLIIKNQETGQEAEVYNVLMRDDRELKDQLEMYEYRKINQTKLVSVYNIQKANSRGFCSGTDSYRVITQRIPLRLSQVEDLQLPEAMYVLKQCLDGFELISESIEGPIEINKQMIGFTPEGKVKIWVNPNFAVNMPQRASYIKGEAYQFDQSIMPLQLVKLVEEQMINKTFPPELKARLQKQSKNTLSFSRMKVVLRNFCIDNNIPSLERLNINIEDHQVTLGGPNQKITTVQETAVQQRSSAEVLKPANVSIVKAVPVGTSGVQGTVNQSISQTPGQMVRHESITQDKIRSLPGGSIINAPFVQQTSPPNVIAIKAHQLNFPLEFPMNPPPPITSTPLQGASYQAFEAAGLNRPTLYNQPRINYKQAIDYQYRPSINSLPPPSPMNVPVPPPLPSTIPASMTRPPQIRQTTEWPAYYASGNSALNQGKFDQYNYSNNHKLPYNPERDFANNLNINLKPQLEYQNKSRFNQNFSSANTPPYSTLQAGSVPSYTSVKPTYEHKFQVPSPSTNRSPSPMKNDPYLMNGTGTLSRENSLTSFKVRDSLNKYGVNEYQTPYKGAYQYATTVKKQKYQTYSPEFGADTLGQARRPLFRDTQPEYKPASMPRNNNADELMRRMDLLMNSINHEIGEATSQYRTERSIN